MASVSQLKNAQTKTANSEVPQGFVSNLHQKAEELNALHQQTKSLYEGHLIPRGFATDQGKNRILNQIRNRSNALAVMATEFGIADLPVIEGPAEPDGGDDES